VIADDNESRTRREKMAFEVTKNGAKILLDRAFRLDDDATYTPISRGWVGIEQTTPLVTDTDLDRPIPIKEADTELVDDCETADWTQGTDSIAETLNSTSYIRGSNSLNLGKSGTTGTVFSYTKTTTSRDFTSKTLFLFVYVATLADLVASGTAITIRFGSDSSNYYYKDIDIDDLSAGWNTLWVDQATASTTGSPVVAACDYSGIFFNTDLAADTVTLGDVRMDHWHLASSGDFAEEFTTGYPSGPGDNLQIEARFAVLDTEGIGFDIDGVAYKNTDSGTPTTAAIAKHLVVGKDSTEQLIEVLKMRVRFT